MNKRQFFELFNSLCEANPSDVLLVTNNSFAIQLKSARGRGTICRDLYRPSGNRSADVALVELTYAYRRFLRWRGEAIADRNEAASQPSVTPVATPESPRVSFKRLNWKVVATGSNQVWCGFVGELAVAELASNGRGGFTGMICIGLKLKNIEVPSLDGQPQSAMAFIGLKYLNVVTKLLALPGADENPVEEIRHRDLDLPNARRTRA